MVHSHVHFGTPRHSFLSRQLSPEVLEVASAHGARKHVQQLHMAREDGHSW
jgi:hypothetical protein